MVIKLSDVASRAGVSLSVASRVLSGDQKARVNEHTRQRVEDAGKELGYFPNHRARALRIARSGAIALIVPDLNNAIFSSLQLVSKKRPTPLRPLCFSHNSKTRHQGCQFRSPVWLTVVA